jgi:hypothetical protein
MIDVRALTAVVPLLFGGCITTPAEFSANESCNLAPNVWYQVETPAERELLLGLAEPGGARPVRERFVASGAQREAWLQDSNGNLKACLYNPLQPRSCYTRELITVAFTKSEVSWVAGPTVHGICSH